MIVRLVSVTLRVALGGHRILWLVVGLVILWLFAFHLYNPWDIIMNATDANSYVFVVIPLYLLLLQADVLHPWNALTTIRVGSARLWWWGQVLAAGVVAAVLAIGVAVLTVVVGVGSGRWSWHWGSYGLHSEPPAVLARPPWNVPWHWSVDALCYFFVGLWVVGVLWHFLALWWRGQWLAWIAVVTLALGSLALKGTIAQGVIWFVPGAQFSFYFHWTQVGATGLAWSLAYGTAMLGATAALGWWLSCQARWVGRHGEPL